MARICLITPFHISCQPRTLREADALSEARHDVRVVSLQTDLGLIQYDRQVMETRRWRLDNINLCRSGSSRNRWFSESIKWKLRKRLFQWGLQKEEWGMGGYLKGAALLLDLASKQPADWFIAHTQAALPVAVKAARYWKARVGFDCEDLLAERGMDPSEVVRWIEKTYLLLCDYVSVPSLNIAMNLRDRYQIPAPIVLYNTFPSSLAKDLRPPAERLQNPLLRLHWFGQTMGPGRGIEEAIEAMGRIGEGVELHLRGRISQEYRRRITGLARRYHVKSKIIFHPVVGYDDLIGTLEPFDVGLALERPENPSTSQTVSNKLFSYLLAGLALAATDTPGQREILKRVPDAGFLYPAGSAATLASRLRCWLANPPALRAAKQAAWQASREEFCWDVERRKFLEVFQPSASKVLFPIGA